MKKYLEELDKDIKRCETVLKENNYLEIVIAVEELVDKYKNYIESIATSIDKDRVWNYSKRDLESLKEKLEKYMSDHIGELMFSNMRHYLTINDEIYADKIEEIKKVLDEIEVIYNNDIKKEEKWNYLKEYLVWISNQEIDIASKMIDIINIMIKIEC